MVRLLRFYLYLCSVVDSVFGACMLLLRYAIKKECSCRNVQTLYSCYESLFLKFCSLTFF